MDDAPHIPLVDLKPRPERPNILILTRADAAAAGQDPEFYAVRLQGALTPYGVEVRFAPDQRGHGCLVNVESLTLEMDIQAAINRLKTALVSEE